MPEQTSLYNNPGRKQNAILFFAILRQKYWNQKDILDLDDALKRDRSLEKNPFRRLLRGIDDAHSTGEWLEVLTCDSRLPDQVASLQVAFEPGGGRAAHLEAG
jgi:hypothetical protein